MRNTVVLASIVFLAANTSHCNLSGPVEHPESGFSHSVSTMICGPADGPATGIMLARNPIPGLEPPYPYVRVSIWQPVTGLKGLYLIDDNLADVSALYYVSADEFVPASAGSVRIDRVSSNNRIEGSVELRFPAPGRAVTEGFNAPWVESLMLCG